MQKAIKVLALIIVLTLAGCTTTTTGGTPLDGHWDNLEIYSGSKMLRSYTNVTISVSESRKNNWSSTEDTWISYKIIQSNGIEINIIDNAIVTLIFWNGIDTQYNPAVTTKTKSSVLV